MKLTNNFFRKDLNLGGRWWHRLFLVIFFVLFAGALYTMSSDLFADNYPYIPQWKIVSSVDERITAEVKQIRDLKKIGERVEEKDGFYALNSSADENSLYDDFYCSTDLESKISEIQSKSGVSNLYLNRKNVSIEALANYVQSNNIKCLIPDAYTNADGTKLRFLEPLSPNSIYGRDLVFYEKSNFLTAFYILKMYILVLLVFVGIAIAYYKVFLYIVFGGVKKDG